VLASALEGQTLFQEAFHLLGVKKSAAFYSAARELGITRQEQTRFILGQV
jgi:hypothetical protein